MADNTTRRALLGLVPLALAGCGSEADQRRAFIDFLRTRVADRPGLRVPVPSAEDRRAFGPYAAHWDVIAGFHEAMNAQVARPYSAMAGLASFRSLQDLVQHRDALATGREAVGRMRAALAAEFQRAEAARAALQQPGDLAPVYEAAYDKLVRAPARAFGAVFPLMEDALASTERLGDTIAANLVRVQISGSTIETREAGLRTQLDAQLREVRARGQALQEAQRRLQDMIAGR
ncbi:DUF3053 family protein [Muricoccus radiodurans]|uniref:DUF3053 family protein n=1 Tax=Muricoccus radiodurans TaxID=2231721 RepID=UPI003CE6943F